MIPLSVIDATGTATTLALTGPASNAGLIEVTGTEASLAVSLTAGTAAAGSLTNTGQIVVDQGDTLTISGGTLADSGTVQVNGGSATIASTVVGLGNFAVGTGGTLQLNQAGLAALTDISFTGTTGFLKLGTPASFTGNIAIGSFAVGDSIDLGPVSISTVVVTGNPGLDTIDFENAVGSVIFGGSFGYTGQGFQTGTFTVGANGGIAGNLVVSQSATSDAVVTVYSRPPPGPGWAAPDRAASAPTGRSPRAREIPRATRRPGDTAIVNSGTVVVLDGEFISNTLIAGSATGVLANDTGLLFPNATSGPVRVDPSTVFESTAAGVHTTLQIAGRMMNYGSVLADASGGTFALSISPYGSGTAALPGMLVNQGEITATNGDVLSITTPAGNAVFANPGIVLADGGDIVATGSIATDNGLWAIIHGGTIELASIPGGEAVFMGSGGGLLRLDQPGNFHGRILPFASGDTVELVNTTVGTVTYNSSTFQLAFLNAGTTITSLTMGGPYNPGTFVLNNGTGTAGSFSISKDAAGDAFVTTGVVSDDWNAGSGDWNTGSNWASGIVPGSSQTALLDPSRRMAQRLSSA